MSKKKKDEQLFKVTVHSVDGVHQIATDLPKDKALAEAMDWLGTTFNEVVPELVYVSMFGERLTIEKVVQQPRMSFVDRRVFDV